MDMKDNLFFETPDKHPKVPVRELSESNEHPSIEMPFTVYVDKRKLEGRSVSLLDAHVSGLLDPHTQGESRLAAFRFDFDSYSINLFIEVVISEASSETGDIVLSFLEPTGKHLPQLRYILNSHIAGDLIGIGSILRVAEEKPAKKKDRPQMGLGFKLRRLAGTLTLVALTALLLLVIANSVYSRFYEIRLSRPGEVVADGDTLRAVASGQVSFINPDATEGDIAFAIRSTTGEVLSIGMPCDCEIVLDKARVGSTVLAGDPIMQVTLPDAPLVVSVPVPNEVLFDLYNAQTIEIEFGSGRVVQASPVTAGGASSGFTGDTDEALVALQPLEPLDAADLGKPVAIRVLKPSPAFLTNTIEFQRKLGSAIWGK
jgi:mannuronan synthase